MTDRWIAKLLFSHMEASQQSHIADLTTSKNMKYVGNFCDLSGQRRLAFMLQNFFGLDQVKAPSRHDYMATNTACRIRHCHSISRTDPTKYLIHEDLDFIESFNTPVSTTTTPSKHSTAPFRIQISKKLSFNKPKS